MYSVLIENFVVENYQFRYIYIYIYLLFVYYHMAYVDDTPYFSQICKLINHIFILLLPYNIIVQY